MTKIAALLADMKGKRVYFDTNSIIYFIEQVAPFYAVVSPIFDEIGMDHIFSFTSELTLTETLIKPMRENNIPLVCDIKDLLLDADLFTLTKTNKKIFMQAAELGGKHGLRTADAIHFASAIENRCHYLVTNDKKFQSHNGVQVVILNNYLAV